MNNIAEAETSGISKTAADTFSKQNISIRVSPNSYLIALFLTTFVAGYMVYLERDWTAAILLSFGWLIIPVLAWTDCITFDGKRIARTGFLSRVWVWLNSNRYSLKISDIEQVESQALRALKRGGNVFYRYRTTLRGKNVKFAFASGGEEYRQMIHIILPLLPENILDNRSIDLRDYLAEPKETLMKAAFAKIPSTDVLESSLNEFQNLGKTTKSRNFNRSFGNEEQEKADYLRQLANELRLSGYLLQSLEAFRRALVLNPSDAWLIFDFARCLNSFAGSEKSKKLQRKSIAALRIAEQRGSGDSKLLARIGESYFQYGDWQRAAKIFKKTVESVEENFRSFRGLAEIALREGRIAYVIQYFSAAQRLAETSALRRWTKNESEYFSLLNHDEDYMEMEISRLNLLDTLQTAKKTCLKISFVGFPLIIFGLIDDVFIGNLGWTISFVSLFIWVSLMFTQNLLSERIPLDFADEE